MSRFELALDIGEELKRLARFGANLSDAHSCFIFLSERCLSLFSTAAKSDSNAVRLTAYHSLSPNVNLDCRVEPGIGLVGWVLKNADLIHVSPFERDSEVIGTYTESQNLKSFIAAPLLSSTICQAGPIGVLACDSKKSFAFSKLQGKLLSELAEQTARMLELSLALCQEQISQNSWQDFLSRAHQFVGELGIGSVEVLRIAISNIAELEGQIGIASTMELVEQVRRLIGQALPPHFPIFHLPCGESIIVSDAMMGSYCQNKIEAISARVSAEGLHLSLNFGRANARQLRKGAATLEQILSLAKPRGISTPANGQTLSKVANYGR